MKAEVIQSVSFSPLQLGLCYRDGFGVKADIDEGLKWLRNEAPPKDDVLE